MSDTFVMDGSAVYAFAPSPELIENLLYQIHLVFEGRPGGISTAIMTPTSDSANDFCDRMNARLGLDHADWTALAREAFATADGDAP